MPAVFERIPRGSKTVTDRCGSVAVKGRFAGQASTIADGNTEPYDSLNELFRELAVVCFEVNFNRLGFRWKEGQFRTVPCDYAIEMSSVKVPLVAPDT